MDSLKLYRLNIHGFTEFSDFMEGWRGKSLSILSEAYAGMVARKAFEIHDTISLGVSEADGDIIKAAGRFVRKAQAGNKGLVPYANLNCAINIYFVKGAILARFTHGNEAYRKAWERTPEVVEWAWRPGARPQGISDKAWRMRGRYWEEVQKKNSFGLGMKFILIDNRLPDLPWANIRRHKPDMETRIRQCMEIIEAAPPSEFAGMKKEKMRTLIAGKLKQKVTEEDFVTVIKEKARANSVKKPSGAKGKSIKHEVKRKTQHDDKASQVDHADILVALDGQIFIAVPYVGFEKSSRVFVQAGDNHLAFSQNGTQYGYVTDVKKSALDVLRGTKTVTLVEVGLSSKGNKRLLRAKHVAIVSDIGLSESFGVAMARLKPSHNDDLIQELDKAQ